VYLTNALTGWKPPKAPNHKLLYPEMEEERDKAERVKQQIPILVILCNPPYYGKTPPPVPMSEEADLVQPYRVTKRAPKPRGKGLNETYVRFFRIAERCITERHVQNGIVCFISNYSWLEGRSHPGMRERFEDEFDQIWIDSLNGDKYKTGKTTPDGSPDPSVFSTPHNREGIQVGTAVALLARIPRHEGQAKIRFRDFWGESKREDLLASGQDFQPRKYEVINPINGLGLAFRSMKTEESYASWPMLEDLFPKSYPGIITARDSLVVDVEEKVLRQRMAQYFDTAVSHEEMKAVCAQAMNDADSFPAKKSRDSYQQRGLLKDNFYKYLYRPFDIRWL
jgi:predicted helicase